MTAGAREQSVVDADASMLALWAEDDISRIATMTKNSLLLAGVYSIGTLTDRAAGDLMGLRDFGPGQLAEVRRVLAAAGLALKGEAE